MIKFIKDFLYNFVLWLLVGLVFEIFQYNLITNYTYLIGDAVLLAFINTILVKIYNDYKRRKNDRS